MATKENNTKDAESILADIALTAELADYSPIKGCMIIRPYGYALWENIRDILDRMIKDTGHENAYFPMLIPESFLQKEAEHVEGFAPECAVVTHAGGKELAEKYVLRPTSETIINYMFSKWINSYRDLPLKLNQWANVMRWEMRTRLFLRTSEFLWQEGHTCHASNAEAEEEVLKMLEVYRVLMEEYLAIPVELGRKTDSEKFAGADVTYSMEALMRDGKALQAGTSHNLGQNFAKAFDTKFTDASNQTQYVYQTSWGVSTRLIGALIMGHYDEVGLILPPRVASYQVVVIPVLKRGADAAQNAPVLDEVHQITAELKALGIRVKLDARETITQGVKFNEYEQKGVPLRIAVGPRDCEQGVVELHRRDTRTKEQGVPRQGIAERVRALLDTIQSDLYQRALKFREEHTKTVTNLDELDALFSVDTAPGYARAMWNGDTKLEELLKTKYKASIRCMPFRKQLDASSHPCIISGAATKENREILIAKAY